MIIFPKKWILLLKKFWICCWNKFCNKLEEGSHLIPSQGSFDKSHGMGTWLCLKKSQSCSCLTLLKVSSWDYTHWSRHSLCCCRKHFLRLLRFVVSYEIIIEMGLRLDYWRSLFIELFLNSFFKISRLRDIPISNLHSFLELWKSKK